MRFPKVVHFLKERGVPAFRIRQVREAVFDKGVADFDKITTLPKALRGELAAEFHMLSVEPVEIKVSRDGRAHKAALRLSDKSVVETVLMQPKPGLWSVCVSSQVGCALQCSFCATGLMGFKRNLTVEEITDQVLFWRQYLAGAHRDRVTGPGAAPPPGKIARPDNVVYMGMGEPLVNLDAVFDSLRSLSHPDEFGMGARHLSVSTSGIAPGIDRFAIEFPQVNLALSLHAATDTLRRRLVPVNRAYNLEKLHKSLKKYFERNNRKVFIEYILLRGENDSLENAQDLVRWLRRLRRDALIHVNLIVFNPTDTPHEPTTPEAAKAFRDHLQSRGVHATIRKNLGQDISGACGQLVVGKTKAAKNAGRKGGKPQE